MIGAFESLESVTCFTRRKRERNGHGGDIFDSQTLLDELNDHAQFAAFACVARVREGDGRAWGFVVF
jgi:hypothetical protein